MTHFLRVLALVALTITVLPTAIVQAQDSTDVSTWTKSLIGQLSGAQAGFSNWAEGGVNTLAVSLGLNGQAERSTRSWDQKHELRLNFGLVRQDTLDFRKAEDLIRIRSAFQYTAGEGMLAVLQPTAAFTFRSQFAEGQNFDKDPFDEGRTPPVKVSQFFSPATFTQTLGLTYDPSSWFTQRFGVSAKETVVLADELRSLYSIAADKSYRAELGLEAYSQVDREIAENVRYQSTLGLFAAFNKSEVPDLIWENAISMKVNSWLNVNFEWTMLYDTDVADDIQAKEVFSVGFSYIFI